MLYCTIRAILDVLHCILTVSMCNLFPFMVCNHVDHEIADLDMTARGQTQDDCTVWHKKVYVFRLYLADADADADGTKRYNQSLSLSCRPYCHSSIIKLSLSHAPHAPM